MFYNFLYSFFCDLSYLEELFISKCVRLFWLYFYIDLFQFKNDF